MASEPEGAPALLGVDVGGTFTDAALLERGRLFTAKVPTTTADQSEGVMAAVESVLARAAADPHRVVRFAHGMTVGTNALLSETGARTALLATEGFTDVIEIGRQARPRLYHLCSAPPVPLVPPELRFGIRARNGPRGEESPLDEGALSAVLEQLADAAPEAVAISLLHSYVDPDHERRVADAVAARLPDAHVSSSHDVLNVFREYERTSTTVIDAYLSPLMSRYLERLARRTRDRGLPEPEIMQSSGGVVSSTEAARHAAWTVLSGPAGGAVGAAYLGSLGGDDNVLSLDMGGTSCDVAVIEGGSVRQTPGREIGGRPLQLPMVDVHTVGAGGGSIAWADAGGALRVGPRSAGAAPGPACYGRGGSEPTVTDANLLMGYLGHESSLAGTVRLDREAAERAVDRLASRLGLDRCQTSAGIVRVADAAMLGALRVVTIERGIDPRGYALVAFGGAGPMHATRLADELGIGRVLCPRAAGVLSALGLVVSDRRRDSARSVMLAGRELTSDAIARAASELAADARDGLPGAAVQVSYDLRYRGQSFELNVEGSERPDPAALRADFERAHRERYGYSDSEAELELVNVRVAATFPGTRPPVGGDLAAPGRLEQLSRTAIFDGMPVAIDVLRGELPPGQELEGPAVCELREATVVVPPGWSGFVRNEGTLVLERR